jgi:hypothetical protein
MANTRVHGGRRDEAGHGAVIDAERQALGEVTSRHRVAYSPEAVLTPKLVAAWLGVSERQVFRYGIKCSRLGARTTRYLAADVYAFLRGNVV